MTDLERVHHAIGKMLTGADEHAARAALDRVAANVLYLSEVPDGWELNEFEFRHGLEAKDLWFCLLSVRPGNSFEVACGAGPTPSTALTAAIKRAKELNNGP